MNNNTLISIKKNIFSKVNRHMPIIYLFMLIPFFEPAYVEDRLWLIDKLFMALQITALFFSIFLVVKKKINISTLFICIIGYQLYLCVVTFVSQGNAIAIVSSTARVFSLFVILSVGLRAEPRRLLVCLRTYFMLLLVLMLVTTLVAPEGMYALEAASIQEATNPNDIRYFLGHKNNTVMFLFPGMLSAGICWFQTKKLIDGMFAGVFMLISAAIALFTDSMTSLVVCVLIVVALIFANIPIIQKVNPFGWLMASLAADVAVSIVRVQEVMPAITRLFGRTVTFSGRTQIWDRMFELLRERPLFGYGYEYADITKARFPNDSFTSAHNIYLSSCYYGGLLGLLMMLVCIVVAIFSISDRRNSITAYLAMFLSIVLIEGIFETVGSGGLTMLVVPLTFMYCSSALEGVVKKTGVAS